MAGYELTYTSNESCLSNSYAAGTKFEYVVNVLCDRDEYDNSKA